MFYVVQEGGTSVLVTRITSANEYIFVQLGKFNFNKYSDPWPETKCLNNNTHYNTIV
jgi:hypothetical protein